MTSTQQPIGKTQTDQAFELIRRDVLSARLRPGAKLKINDLCARFDLGLGAVREALSRLSADGLVVAHPQRGYTVAPVSRSDLIDLTRARVEIEQLCLVDAIANGDVAWEGKVLEAFHRLRHLPELNPKDGLLLDDQWSLAHDDFHSKLTSACTSKWLMRVRAQLFAQAERYRRLSVPLDTGGRDVNAEHHELLKAVIMRDAERARSMIQNHLNTTTKIILDSMEEMEAMEKSATPARRLRLKVKS
jgi:GntR family transcriptional regulator, carbon starvation induced regulator